MKRKIVITFLALVCVLACAFGLTACGGNRPTGNGGGDIPPEKFELTVTLDKSELEMKVGEKRKLKATVTPDPAGDKRIHWESDNEYAVSVFDEGDVIANNVGTATITASCENYFAQCKVTVIDEPSDFNFELKSDMESYVLKSVKQKTTSDAVIPATYNGLPVTTVGTGAFEDCTELKNVVLPDSITQIDDRAFAGCSSLASVTIPDSVTFIDNGAFKDCTELKSIAVPDDVTYIGLGTFENCNGLTSITVPYVGCMPTWGRYFGYIFGAADISNNGEKVPSSLKTVTITNDTVIPWGAFNDCSSITRVDVPDSVTSIGSEAFGNCTSLNSFDIPDGVTTIGISAFENCSSLTSITLPESVTEIGSFAFEGCTSVTSRYYTGSIAAWMGIRGLANFCFYEDNTKLYIDNVEITGDLILPDGITSIASYAFYRCPLTSIVIPDGVETIGGLAFAYCTELTSINIPDSVTAIGSYAFQNCTSLTEIVIPESVIEMSNGIFYDCTSLESITIPFVGRYHPSNDFRDPVFGSIFYDLNQNASLPSSLKAVTVAGGTIATSAFANCSYITDITVSDGVTSIGYNAFGNCNNLESITLPFAGESPKSAQNKHFGYIFGASTYNYNENSVPSSLKTVTVAGNATIDDYAFLKCTSLTTVEIGKGVKSIGRYSFDGCSSLESVTIGDDVKTIEVFAFRNCALKDLTIPNNVTSVGQYAFYNNAALKSVTMSNSVLSINNYVFYGCTSLESVTLPNGVKGIGNYAFCGCTSLLYITIPDSVTAFGDSALADCTSLKGIYFGGKTSRWTSVKKPDGWDNNSGNYFVRCSDGKWDKFGNEINDD